MKTLRFVLGLLVGGVAMVTGCDWGSSGLCLCPGDGIFDMVSTANLPSDLVEVSADSPCTATLVPGYGDGGAASVSVSSGDPEALTYHLLTCHLHGRLADGETIAATISFHSETIQCGCSIFLASDGGFSLNDAGADGP
jgi:hypothetical protein